MAEPTTGVRNCIRTLRFMAGEMTQQDLANRIGVSRQTLNAIEGGKYSPSLEVAFKIAKVFGKGVGEVFEWVERGLE
jgi:putative transcriptional regulator